MSERKICFVIAPIGEEESETRKRSDQVLKYIITPAVSACGYEPIRADQISEPGIITSQVIQHIVDDPLVVADLSERNANVFYELSLRHALRKPVVQLIHAKEVIPFDVAATRTIKFDHHDLASAEQAKEEITRQIRAVESNPAEVDTPISSAIELQRLQRSDNPIERSNAEIMEAIQELRHELRSVVHRQDVGAAEMMFRLKSCRAILAELMKFTSASAQDLRDAQRIGRVPAEYVKEVWDFIAECNRMLESLEGVLGG